MNTQELVLEAISRPVDERAIIADSLLKSLNPPESIIDKEWAKLAKQRLSEIKSGDAKVIPGKEVFQKIRERFSS